jgi:hypothetical protein
VTRRAERDLALVAQGIGEGLRTYVVANRWWGLQVKIPDDLKLSAALDYLDVDRHLFQPVWFLRQELELTVKFRWQPGVNTAAIERYETGWHSNPPVEVHRLDVTRCFTRERNRRLANWVINYVDTAEKQGPEAFAAEKAQLYDDA